MANQEIKLDLSKFLERQRQALDPGGRIVIEIGQREKNDPYLRVEGGLPKSEADPSSWYSDPSLNIQLVERKKVD